MIIDLHTHIVPEHFPPVGNRAAGDHWPFMDHQEPGRANVIIGGRNFRTVLDRCWSVTRRTNEMPAQAVDMQVLSPMPELLAYHLDPQDGLELSHYLNEVIARMMEEAPERFYGLGAVPLQSVEMAASELSRVKELGLQGVEVLTNVNGKSVGDPAFRPFFKEADALGLAVFVHAQHPTFTDRLVGPAIVENAVGFPIENELAVAGILTGGMLEECPSLRLCFSHGGGGFALMLPRIQNAWESPRNEALREVMPKSPQEYAQRMYYDDLLLSLKAIRFLIDTMGASQVVMGSDYPFGGTPQGGFKMVPATEELASLGLTPEERELIGSANCLRFLGVKS